MRRQSTFSSTWSWFEYLYVLFQVTWLIKFSSSQSLHDSRAVPRPVLPGSSDITSTPAGSVAETDSSCSSLSSPWNNLVKKRTMAEETNECSSVPSSENALVLYSPPILERFHRSERTFHLANRNFSIKQNWADFGVAAVVWDAAIVLCEYLEVETKLKRLSLEGKRVIELGAGTGLVGMVASHLKGRVTITDRASIFKPLRKNILFNFQTSSSSSSLPAPSSTTDSSVSSCSNTNAPSEVNSTFKPQSSTPKVKVLEWGQDLHKFSEPFDIIIGADIVYIEDTFRELLQTLLHLSNKNTLILLSCRIRYKRDNNFLDMMKTKFQVEHVFHDIERGIEIYSARKL
nr:protein N-lysine methyltransferase METTL21A-like [Lytechinus pictus]